MKEFPKIGFGTWEIVGQENIDKSIKAAIESGYKHIDTAQIYNNEYQIGNILEKLNKNNGELFITSKVWPKNYKLYTYKSVEESLRRLKVKKIDMMLLHAPLPIKRIDDIIIAYKELMRAREDNLIDYIGVSNFTIPLMEAIKEETGEYPYSNQIILSPTVILEDIEEFCKKKNIKLIGYSTLRSYFNPNPWYEGSGMNEKQKEYIDSLVKKYQKNPGQILSKWALQEGYHIIPKSVNPERIKSNIILDDFELTENERKELRSWNTYTSEKMFLTFSTQLENQNETYDEIAKRGLLFDKNF